MVKLDIPGWGEAQLNFLVLDLNGTIAVDGTVPDEIVDRVRRLSDQLKVFLLTADTFGTAGALVESLGAELTVLAPGGREAEQKADFVRALGPERCASVGNGANDILMLQIAAVGIAVLGREGAAAGLLPAADVIVTDPADALDLLLAPKRLIATLRR